MPWVFSGFFASGMTIFSGTSEDLRLWLRRHRSHDIPLLRAEAV